MTNYTSDLAKMIVGALCGASAVIGGFVMNDLQSHSKNSQTPRTLVQESFVNPRDVKITSADVDKSDGKGRPETYVSIGTNTYAFRYDTNGRPTLSPYRIEPQRVTIEEPERR